MKTTLLFALVGWPLMPASADRFVGSTDPSGAPMCFTEAGQKAPLVHCQPTPTYISRLDPSGAPMCFTDAGRKAPLLRCNTEAQASVTTSAGNQLAGITPPRK